MKILIINGPNMNLTGRRDPGHYGNETLDEINAYIKEFAGQRGAEVDFFQSNVEGELINALHGCIGVYDGVVINPAACTHYSYALRDAIEAVGIPCVEAHMSNIFAREDFRRTSVTAPVCKGLICGFGKNVYTMAIEYLINAECITHNA